jgi:hypothetical protein
MAHIVKRAHQRAQLRNPPVLDIPVATMPKA